MAKLTNEPTIQEIMFSYKEEQNRLINESFDIGLVAAKNTAMPLSQATSQHLGDKGVRDVWMAQAEAVAAGLRDEKKTRYAEIDAELKAVVEARVEHIEEVLLAPENVTPGELLQASQMNEEQLSDALATALDLGLEDSVLLLFKVARDRNFDSAVAMAISRNERLADLYAELSEWQAIPEMEPDDRFEMFAADIPSGQQILSEAQKDINILPQL